jgi:hypothetical protein
MAQLEQRVRDLSLEQEQQRLEQDLLRRQLQHRMRSTISASQLGREITQRPDWAKDSTVEILRFLCHQSQQVNNAAQALVRQLPSSWTEMAHKEIEERQRTLISGTRKRRRADAPLPAANSEGEFQLAMGFLLRQARQQQCQWYLHDTSSSGLVGREAPVDYCFMASPDLTVPAQVIFVIELKKELSAQTAYHEVIGQLEDRCTLIFQHQPAQRSHIFAVGAGRDGVVVLRFPRPDSGRPILHSGNVKPFGNPLSAKSEGLQLLLSVLLAPHDTHSFVSVVPPDVALEGFTFTELQLVDWQSGDSTLSAVNNATTIRGSQVWRAKCSGRLLDRPQLVAIKTGSRAAIDQEVSMSMSRITRCSHALSCVSHERKVSCQQCDAATSKD